MQRKFSQTDVVKNPVVFQEPVSGCFVMSFREMMTCIGSKLFNETKDYESGWAVKRGDHFVSLMARHRFDDSFMYYNDPETGKRLQTVIRGSLAKDLWKAAENLLSQTSDSSHCFIQEFEVVEDDFGAPALQLILRRGPDLKLV